MRHAMPSIPMMPGYYFYPMMPQSYPPMMMPTNVPFMYATPVNDIEPNAKIKPPIREEKISEIKVLKDVADDPDPPVPQM
jgi:hypothetical protein